MIAMTIAAPELADRPIATLLGPAPVPTVYEIQWHKGPPTGPFLSEEQAVNHVINTGGASLKSDELFVDDDMRVYSLDADEGALVKHYEGAICEVKP